MKPLVRLAPGMMSCTLRCHKTWMENPTHGLEGLVGESSINGGWSIIMFAYGTVLRILAEWEGNSSGNGSCLKIGYSWRQRAHDIVGYIFGICTYSILFPQNTMIDPELISPLLTIECW